MKQLNLFTENKKSRYKTYWKKFYSKQLKDAEIRRSQPKEIIAPPIGSISILITPGL